MNADEKSRYFQELTLNLQHDGFVVKPEPEEGLLPVELDGQRLCLALDTGAVRYWRADAADDYRSAALDKVITITKTTVEYMSQLESVPQLTASGLTGDYRLLADFNGVVLAGHPTQYGVQFITWERVQERTGLNAGNYYGPLGGIDSYTAAKRNFVARSGLVPRSALFNQEQLIIAALRHWLAYILSQISSKSACNPSSVKSNAASPTWVSYSIRNRSLEFRKLLKMAGCSSAKNQ